MFNFHVVSHQIGVRIITFLPCTMTWQDSASGVSGQPKQRSRRNNSASKKPMSQWWAMQKDHEIHFVIVVHLRIQEIQDRLLSHHRTITDDQTPLRQKQRITLIPLVATFKRKHTWNSWILISPTTSWVFCWCCCPWWSTNHLSKQHLLDQATKRYSFVGSKGGPVSPVKTGGILKA